MQRVRRSPEVKAEALSILAEHGLAEAVRRTGIPEGTIASWGSRNGVSSPPLEATAHLVAGLEINWAKRKLLLGERLGKLAEGIVERIEERIADDRINGVRDLAASMAVVIDKAQLLTGDATSRTEIVSVEEQEQAIATVRELRNVA